MALALPFHIQGPVPRAGRTSLEQGSQPADWSSRAGEQVQGLPIDVAGCGKGFFDASKK